MEKEDEGQGEPEAKGVEDTKEEEVKVAQPENWRRKMQQLPLQWKDAIYDYENWRQNTRRYCQVVIMP